MSYELDGIETNFVVNPTYKDEVFCPCGKSWRPTRKEFNESLRFHYDNCWKAKPEYYSPKE